uniref:Large ribosomal subunit protein bL21m n=1 Tax=Nothoprocta perdicaria TaxID=30464 RepID=A0A8C7EC78_NOTPE
MIATGQYGRLFAVVHFASKQWKVTSEDLIMMDNELEAECGDRIRLEKVLLVGADDFTLIGRPLLGKELVRVEATVIEKTESWPKISMRFWKRHNYQRMRGRWERAARFPPAAAVPGRSRSQGVGHTAALFPASSTLSWVSSQKNFFFFKGDRGEERFTGQRSSVVLPEPPRHTLASSAEQREPLETRAQVWPLS